MNVAEVSRKLSDAGRENAIKVVPTFKTVSMDELAEKSFSDEFANVVKVALVNNSDCEQDL